MYNVIERQEQKTLKTIRNAVFKGLSSHLRDDSSAGRAPGSQPGCRGFESLSSHICTAVRQAPIIDAPLCWRCFLFTRYYSLILSPHRELHPSGHGRRSLPDPSGSREMLICPLAEASSVHLSLQLMSSACSCRARWPS